MLLFTSVSEGWAQTANQAQLTREQAPSAFPSTVPPTGAEGGNVAAAPGDADLGEQQILKRTDEYQPFTISAGAPFYWTSNVALTRSGEQSDFVVAPAVAAFYEPRITNTLYGLIDVREQLFYYDRFDNFNFGSFDVEVGLRYLVPQWHNLLLRLEYDYNRLTEKNSFAAFFQNHAIIIDAGIPFQFGRAQTLTLGADLNISIAAEESGQPPNINAISAQRSDYARLSWLFGGSHPFLFRQCRGHARSAPVLRRRPRRHQRSSRAYRKLSCEQISYGERCEYVGGKPIQPKRFRLPSGQPWWRSGPPGEVLDSSIPVPDNPNTPTE